MFAPASICPGACTLRLPGPLAISLTEGLVSTVPPEGVGQS